MPFGHDAPLHRPVAFVVDPSVYGEPVPPPDADGIDHLVRTDLRYHFRGTSGAEYWNALCQAPEYAHQELVRMIDRWFPEALRASPPDPGTQGREIRLVSLGPGNGDIDVRLLAQLEGAFGQIAYSCVDSSFELLRRAVARIAGAGELLSQFPIEAICADFTSVDAARARGRIDLLSLMGGTLGNYREDVLIERLKKWMKPNSQLLIDAWLWVPNGWNGARRLTVEEERSLTSTLSFQARNQFVFGPLELATTATARDVTFGHEVNRSITVVPGAVNIVTYCSNLRARVRLTDEPIVRQHVPLAATTRYDFERLAEWFGSVGLTVVWRKAVGPAGVFMLRQQ